MSKFVFARRRMLILGYGSIARTLLPMIEQNFDIDPSQVLVVSDAEQNAVVLATFGYEHRTVRFTPENLSDEMGKLAHSGDVVVNLTGGVGAIDLVRFCLCNGIDYIDTSNERWEFGALFNDSGDFAAAWKRMIDQQDELPKSATALVSHGANPGLVNHFAKQAVEDLLALEGLSNEGDWSANARTLGIEALHISEWDTQVTKDGAPEGWFYNTWSVEGLVEEANSAPCFAWGSHEEPNTTVDLRRDRVYDVAMGQGHAKDFLVQSWLPSSGTFAACVTPHEETFSIAELFTSGTGDDRYQPTVMFAYRPCQEALDLLPMSEKNALALKPKVMNGEIKSGHDELGLLVLRSGHNDVYWYGSTLDINTARALVPGSNATTMQVAAGVLGGLVWLLENAKRGLVSPEQADHKRVLDVARPYLGALEGVAGIWHLDNGSPENPRGDGVQRHSWQTQHLRF